MEPFLCVCGRAAEPPVLHDQPWARYVGYGDHGVVEFCASQSDAMSADNFAGLLETRPKPKNRCWVRLSHPFVISEAPFWCVYQTPMMAWNGPEPDGDELAKWALVQFQVLKVEDCLSPDRERKLAAEVEVLAVLTLDDLTRLPLMTGPVSGDAARQLIQDDDNLDRLEPAIWQGDYAFVAATERETDWGQWAILHRRKDHIELLVSGHWGFHHDHFWAGRVQMIELPDYLQKHLLPRTDPVAQPVPVKERLPTPRRPWLDIRFQWPKGRW